ncbi:MAG: hypothetical protein RLZZ238_798 [Planctomycetota bacterium]
MTNPPIGDGDPAVANDAFDEAILAWPTMRPTSVGDRTTARRAPSQPHARAIDFAAIATRAKPIDARRVGTPVARTIDARTIGPRASRTALLTLERIDDRAAEAEFEAAGTCVRIVRIDGRARALGCG